MPIVALPVFHQRRFAVDLDGLNDRADLQNEIDLGALVYLQGDTCAEGRLKPFQLGTDTIASNRQTRGGVDAAFIGLRPEDRAGLFLCNLYLGAPLPLRPARR